jgi:hypothetical protein
MSLDFDLYLDQGSDFSVNLTVIAQDGTAMDLTGYSVMAKMRRSYYSIICYDLGPTISDVLDGVITLSISSLLTSILWPARYVYDVTITSAGGLTSRVFEGVLTVSPGITSIPQPESYEPLIAKGSLAIAGVSSVIVFA